MSNRRATWHDARPYWLLEFVTRGELMVKHPGGNWLTLTENEGVLYAPGTPYEERVRAKVCASVWACFDVDEPHVTQSLGPDQPLKHVRDPQGLARHCIEELQPSLGDDMAEQLTVHGRLCELVGLLIAAMRGDGVPTIVGGTSTDGTMVQRADRFMRAHLTEPCRASDVAAHVGLSESGLHHAYRRATGQTPMAVMRTMRVEAARAMLIRGAKTLDQIASETGFADAFHLSRTFKRHHGVSPRAYLQRNRSNAVH